MSSVRAGVAELPLHSGSVPRWLLDRMTRLSGLIVKIMVEEFGVRETVRRFSNPVFFQAFSNVIGMDWDSSGSTTVTTAVLKIALSREEIGVKVLGGKGSQALRVQEEIDALSREYDVDAERLKMTSRLVAKVDNVALQDGYSLYHHSIIVGCDGSWTVVQQGMNVRRRLARRYHWWMETSFISDPHSGILGIKEDYALNLVSSRSEECRKTILDIVRGGSLKVVRDLGLLKSVVRAGPSRTITSYIGGESIEAIRYHPYIASNRDVVLRLNVNERAVDRARESSDFRELLLTHGLGPNTMLALALIAEVIYTSEADWRDPVTHDPRRYAFALGGKDGSPYPVNREVYDAVIDILSVVCERLRSDRGISKYLRHLAEVSRRIALPLDMVRPTPP